jgi:DNA-binding XRE family transcriptional regulator
MSNYSLSYRARQALHMTTTEAAQLVHVTRRTWEMWESGKAAMPKAKQELFIAKLEGQRTKDPLLVVVLADDGLTPIDVVASDGFCSLLQAEDGAYVISSLAISRENGRPYVHRQRFRKEHNSHVIRAADTWRSVMAE